VIRDGTAERSRQGEQLDSSAESALLRTCAGCDYSVADCSSGAGDILRRSLRWFARQSLQSYPAPKIAHGETVKPSNVVVQSDLSWPGAGDLIIARERRGCDQRLVDW
jgi:hypothetical protein